MPTKLATRPMAAAIPLGTEAVVLVDHGNGAGWGFTVDGWPVPNAMLLPAGLREEGPTYNLIIGGIFADTLTRDEALRWAARTARWYQTMIGTANGHATNGNGAKASRTTRAPRAGASRTTAPKPTRARAAPRK